MSGPGSDEVGVTGRPTPVEVTRDFVDAVAWGEHRRVWDLLGTEGRRTVLRVASKRGMDEKLAARLRGGTAGRTELDSYLADLVNGLRADLSGGDLDAVGYRDDPAPMEGGPVWVVVTSPMPEALGGEVPVATVELAEEDGTWKVTRVSPAAMP